MIGTHGLRSFEFVCHVLDTSSFLGHLGIDGFSSSTLAEIFLVPSIFHFSLNNGYVEAIFLSRAIFLLVLISHASSLSLSLNPVGIPT